MCFLCSLKIDISSPHYKNVFYILSSQKFLEFLEKQFLEKSFSYIYHKVFKNSFINFLKKRNFMSVSKKYNSLFSLFVQPFYLSILSII